MRHIYPTFILFFFLCSCVWAQEKQIDLEKELASVTKRERVDTLNTLSIAYKSSNPLKSQEFAQEALILAKTLNYAKGEATATKNIGVVYLLQANYSQALEYFLNALKLYESLGFQKGIAETLHDIGSVYQEQEKYKKARKYYEKVLAIDEKTKDEKGQAGTLNNIGDIYYQAGDYQEALNFFRKSLQMRKHIRDKTGIAISLKNIGLVYYDQNKYQRALHYYLQSLKIDQELGNQANMAGTLNTIALAYLKIEKSDTALYYAQKSLELAEKLELNSTSFETSLTLAEIYAVQENYEAAYQNQFLAYFIGREMRREEREKKVESLQKSYQLEKTEKELALSEKEYEKQRQFLYMTGTALLLMLSLAGMLYRSNRQKKQANLLLTESNAEINQQKEEIMAQRDALEEQGRQIAKQHAEIVEKNNNIESSIRYALRIQEALLPYPHLIDVNLPHNFIFYLPRDVVSGDFYWFYKTEPQPIYKEMHTRDGVQQVFEGFGNSKVIVAAIDCTGHGVPGAFMSMIGDSLLNQIVIDRHITEADQILSEMHKGINKALKQKETKNTDGMDMALCVIDFETKTLEYAGAKNSLLYVKNKELQEIKADIYSIGGWQSLKHKGIHIGQFTRHTLSFEDAPITFYLYSDGYQDQFGGPKNRKFMRKRFKELLYKIHKEPMSYQYKLLEKEFRNWMGENSQVDDVLIMGFRVG